jgi:hypothetical protein
LEAIVPHPFSNGNQVYRINEYRMILIKKITTTTIKTTQFMNSFLPLPKICKKNWSCFIHFFKNPKKNLKIIIIIIKMWVLGRK